MRVACTSSRQTSAASQHTDCNLLSSLQIYSIQYQCPLLLLGRRGSLLEMLLYQKMVSLHFLFIENSPYQLGSCRLTNIRVFNLCICCIYCSGFFPSPSPLATFMCSEANALRSLMAWVHLPHGFKFEPDTGLTYCFVLLLSQPHTCSLS